MLQRRLAAARISRGEFSFWVVLLLTLGLATFYLTRNLMLAQIADPDEGVYLMVARLLNHGAPYSSFYFDQFYLFPQILGAAFRVFGDSVETGRLVVVAFAVWGLAAVGLLTRQLGAKWAAPLAILITLINPYYLSHARYALSDVPCVACTFWAVVLMLVYRRRGGRVWLVLASLTFTAALVIKPLAIPFAIPIVIWFVQRHLRRAQGHWQFAWRTFLLDGLVFLGVGVLVAAPFMNLLDLPGEYQRTVGFHWAEKDYLAPALATRAQALGTFLDRNEIWFALASIGLLTGLGRRPGIVLPLVAAEIFSALLLLQLPPWSQHYALLAPLVAVWAAVGVAEGVRALVQFARAVIPRVRALAAFPQGAPSLQRAMTMSLAFIIALYLASNGARHLANHNKDILNDSMHNATVVITYLQQHTTPGDYLMSDNPAIVFIAGDLIPPSAINLPYESTFHFESDSRAKFEQSIRDYDVKGIVVTDAYRSNPFLKQYIASHFPQIENIGTHIPHQISASYHVNTLDHLGVKLPLRSTH